MNKSKLNYWSQITEILSGLAVLITLVILVIEVRENTSVTRMATYQDEIDRANEWRYSVTSDPDQRYVFQQWTLDNTQALDSEQQFTLRMVLSSLFSQRESAYFAMTNGFLGDSELRRMFEPAGSAYNRTKATTDMWGQIAGGLTEEFVDLLESDC